MDIHENRLHNYINRSNTLYKWLKKKMNGESIRKYFDDNEMFSVAVYGYNDLARLFIQELENSGMEVLYIIDRNPELTVKNKRVIQPRQGDFPKVDVIVVAVVGIYEVVEEQLNELTDILVVSLEEVVG